MTLLVIQLAARPQAGDSANDAPSRSFQYVLSPDGVAVGSAGRAPAAGLPRADTVVAVLPASAVAWHRVVLPRAPAARLRQALAGLLEEQLLDEPEDTHLAIAPQARAGESCWVAACSRQWLTQQLAALESAGMQVDRAVPGMAPSATPGLAAGEAAQGHFFMGDARDEPAPAELWLAWADADAAMCMRTSGSLARSLLPPNTETAHFSATPAAAVAAERWLGAPVPVRSEAEQALACARSAWNLRQFELAPHARGLRALRGMGRQFMGPAWRPARFGLAALLLIQLAGLNTWAWMQQRQIAQRREAIDATLTATHPQVRSILDAPVQMQRETELLRSAAGKAGDEDLETLLGLTAAAWPEGRPPVERLRFEPGRLVLPAAGWDPPALQQLRSRLEGAGGRLEATPAELTISRPARKAAK